jgi:hypothetical protein
MPILRFAERCLDAFIRVLDRVMGYDPEQRF